MTPFHRRTIRIKTGDENPVRADLYMPPRQAGICILCPGFKGHRNWGFFPYLAERLAGAGFAALTIDFSHNGTIPSDDGPGNTVSQLYCDPGRFSRNTISRECDDLRAVIRAVQDDGLDGALDRTLPLALFGHSRAGVPVILMAHSFSQVRAIASWGTPVHPDIFSEEQKRKWRETGALEFTDAATGTLLRVGTTYLDDIEQNSRRFDLARAVTDLATPYLIVNGTADIPVPPEAAIRLFRANSGNNTARLLLVRASHTFGAAGTAFTPTVALERAAGETVDWFRTYTPKGAY